MKKKSLTLAEVMISVFIFVLGVGAIFAVYPPLFDGVEVTYQTMRAWSECRKEIEILKSRSFTELWTEAGTSNPHGFLNDPGVMRGMYYLDKLGSLDDALRITVVVSVKAKGRTIGEDTDLNGVLDSGEDANENTVFDSPITLSTIVINQ